MSAASTSADGATLVRRMTDADIPRVATVSAEAFEIDIVTPAARRYWEQRLRHSLRDRPRGVVRERAGWRRRRRRPGGIRERLWILSLMTVSPSARSRAARAARW